MASKKKKGFGLFGDPLVDYEGGRADLADDGGGFDAEGYWYGADNKAAYFDAKQGGWVTLDGDPLYVSKAEAQRVARGGARYDEDGCEVGTQKQAGVKSYNWEEYDDAATPAAPAKVKNSVVGGGQNRGSEVTYEGNRTLSASYVAAVASALAGTFNVQVKSGGHWAADPTTKTLIYDESIRRLDKDAAAALILHEVGHLVHTTAAGECAKEMVKSARMGQPLFHFYANALEDVRIDSLQAAAFPEGGAMLACLENQTVEYFRKMLAESEEKARNLSARAAFLAGKTDWDALRADTGDVGRAVAVFERGNALADRLAKESRYAKDAEAREVCGLTGKTNAEISEFLNRDGVSMPRDVFKILGDDNHPQGGWEPDYIRRITRDVALVLGGEPIAAALQDHDREEKRLAARDAAVDMTARAVACRMLLRTKGILMPEPIDPDTWLTKEGAAKKGAFSGWKEAQSRKVYGYESNFTYSDEYAESQRARYRHSLDLARRAEAAAGVAKAAKVWEMPSTLAVSALVDNEIWPIIADLFPPDYDAKRAQRELGESEGGGAPADGRTDSVVNRGGGTDERDRTLEVDYRRSRDQAAPAIADCARRFRASVRDNAATRYGGRHRSGKLSPRNVARVGYSDDPRPFERRKEKKDYTFAVSVLVDRSGSMGSGDKSRLGMAMRALAVVGETLKGVRGAAWEAAFFADRWGMAKGYGEPLDPLDLSARASLPEIGEGTLLEKPLKEAIKRIKARPESRKLAVVVTDGDIGDPDEAERIIADAGKRGVQVMMINVGGYGDEVGQLSGLDNFTAHKIRDAADIPAKFVEVMRGLLK